MDFNFAPLREKIDDRYPDSMQPARGLIGFFLELSPEQRQSFLHRIECGHKLTAFYQLVRAHAEQSVLWNAPSLFEQSFVEPQHAL